MMWHWPAQIGAVSRGASFASLLTLPVWVAPLIDAELFL
jgi:hypothetical protein